MKIQLLCVGKLRDARLAGLCGEYAGRISRYGALEILEVKPARARSQTAAVAEESERLLAALRPGDCVWILDARGKLPDSPGLAARLSALEQRAVKRLVIVLGGAYGVSETMRARGECLSLSPLTFPHELCRAILLEQLYRARTIQRGEPYHHG